MPIDRDALVAACDAARAAWKAGNATNRYQRYLVYVDASRALDAHDNGTEPPPPLALGQPDPWTVPEPFVPRPECVDESEYPRTTRLHHPQE